MKAVEAMTEDEVKDLVERLGSRDFEAAQVASESLLSVGPCALDALIEGLSHPNWRVRMRCAGLMDHLGDDRCVEPLRRALKDPIAGVRRWAVHALGCQPCKPAPLQADIIGLLMDRATNDPSIQVRRVSVHMLGLQPFDERAVTALEQILRDDTDAKLLSRARSALDEQMKRRKYAPIGKGSAFAGI